MKRLVLLGGGHSQVEVLRQFAMHPVPDTDITVVTRDLLAPYSGMLPGFIAGHYTYGDIHIDVRNLAKAAGARVVQSECVGLDLEKQIVVCPDRPDVAYDLLSINTGSRPALDDAPGAAQFAIPAKPVDQFIQRFEKLLSNAKDAVLPDAQASKSAGAQASASDRGVSVAIVGGGAGGVELAMTMHHRMKTQGIQNPNIHLITNSDTLLPTHNRSVQKRVTQKFKDKGIHFTTQRDVVLVEKDKVHLAVAGSPDPATEADPAGVSSTIKYSHLIWTTHAAAPDWVKDSGLQTDDQGFILVNDYLQSTSHPNIFAAGDIATMQSTPRPKSGVFAVRQGPYLTDNLRAAAENKPLTKFDPQKQVLSLLGTGDLNAIASRGPFAAQGKWVWDWKNHIDQKFMTMYGQGMNTMAGSSGMPGLHEADGGQPVMMCGGCGSKVGQTLLEQALSEIHVHQNRDIKVGLNHPDDAAVVQYPPNTEIVHTVDHFKSFIDDTSIFGQVTAAHCLSDCYAMGAAPHNALATVTLAHGSDLQQSAILKELLLGANKVLNQDHVALVGGHTAEGQELSFGLTINGTINPKLRTTKTGVQKGDVLILTKPIGTGVLFAADMQKQARTYWLDAAIKQMIKTNKSCVDSLSEYFAGVSSVASSDARNLPRESPAKAVHAATDLTGFGLIGHLAEMMKGSGLQANLNIDSVPLLDGALECSKNGIHSTLYPQNLISENNVENRSDASKNALYPLFFDPQTSGGLLIAVSTEDPDQLTAKTGGTIIGTIGEGNNSGKSIRIS
jgi:selenide,water dikinase